MLSGEAVFREALEMWGNGGEQATRELLWKHFEEVLHHSVTGELPSWKVLLQDAVNLAAKEGVAFSEIGDQFDSETEKWYVNNGDQENPDPDNVYDMIKDKELGL